MLFVERKKSPLFPYLVLKGSMEGFVVLCPQCSQYFMNTLQLSVAARGRNHENKREGEKKEERKRYFANCDGTRFQR